MKTAKTSRITNFSLDKPNTPLDYLVSLPLLTMVRDMLDIDGRQDKQLEVQ